MGTEQLGLEPTADLELALADLAEHGLCLIADVLTADALAAVHDLLYELADRSPDAGRGYPYDRDRTNQRVWALLAEGQPFVDLVTNPTALGLVRHLLGQRVLLSNISANITSPGGGEMVMHADQGYLPEPWPELPQAANATWMVDDFKADTGATLVAPGSHLLGHGPQHLTDGQSSPELVSLEAPAGTLCVMDGRLWHQTGVNTSSSERRAGIFSYYTRPHIRGQENWQRSLSADQLAEADADPVLADLLGLRSWHALGLVGGAEV
ncbi:MAG: ectoine hydroxylase-related dioxygenase (phytanoyl-CoA dioxygenase family) [Acidimicrobiales bacterium]|jgi:ectoine hydroxylase-related dioxygenase (phytanoyl-CoA dioxygenase family)